MSFLSIVITVLACAIILAIILALLHIFVALIPVILIVIGILWLVSYFKKDQSVNNFTEQSSTSSDRKPARDASDEDLN